ncbi:glycogenin glucosyltransferase [Coemansia sp. RSA 1694]|nr:glycogenin glucosyltransferase [Coemansia sp. RSA 25]KAJ2628346.1 glycogenin glucosyltransferase [Coemansia sp. RSA 1694]
MSADNSSAVQRVCFATLLTTDSYMHGALALAASLRATGTRHEIICLVADGQLSRPALERLDPAFDRIVSVPILDTNDTSNLALLGRPDLGSTVTKVGVWALTEYERVAFLDADTLVLGSIDSLLCLDPSAELLPGEVAVGRDCRPNGGILNEGLLAAAPDLGWPDCFNSGVFVAKPSASTHTRLLSLLASQGSFDGGDQGLLNAYFDNWSRADHTRRLPFAYNTTSTSFYTYAPAFAHFADSIKVVHFIGAQKPWKWRRAHDGSLLLGATAATPYDSNASPFAVFIEKWWSVHDAHVSLWSPAKGHFSQEIALSLSEHYGPASGLGSYTREQPANANSGSSLSFSSHVLDDAWKREGNDYASVVSRGTGDNSWSEFLPAHDFALSPANSGRSSGNSSGIHLDRKSD